MTSALSVTRCPRGEVRDLTEAEEILEKCFPLISHFSF